MPELPEVETVVRGLRPRLVGRTIVRARIYDERLVRPEPAEAVEMQLAGRVVVSIRRRGKYIVWELDDEGGALIHLRMTGSFSTGEPGTFSEDEPHAGAARGHVRASYELDNGVIIRYHDARRFGTLEVGELTDLDASLNGKLGTEPLDAAFTAQSLQRRLAGKRAPMKSALLDQRVVAGLGNIYVDESLHIARINPLAEAGSVSRARLNRLVPAIVARLEEAIDAGGSTLRDYRGVEGADGTMQERFLVYGRAGLPCRTCGRALRSAVVGGRTTVWCGTCQR